jgi:membrane-bound metal-dependent hydrolase YbcI (DUF457 family)
MPGYKVHSICGGASGLAAGLMSLELVPQEHRTMHLAACTLGGVLGGRLPDLLEPATSPNHRGVCHSGIAVTGLIAAVQANWQAVCRERAVACDNVALSLPADSSERANEEMKALLWRAFASLLTGLVAGYASHLLLDAGTERSLPLLGNGL